MNRTDAHPDPHRPSRSAVIALLLLVPVPSIGVAAAMLLDLGDLGNTIYAIAKVWLIALPAFWYIVVDRQRISLGRLPDAGRNAFGVGLAFGTAMAAAIIGGYWFIGRQIIDPEQVRDIATQTGLIDLRTYIGLALYLTFVNALVEEYVWRWFTFRQTERIVGTQRRVIAIGLAALFFTIHHTFALIAQFDWLVVVLGSLGVFAGGAIWSWLYQRYRSIWVCYVSHILADVGVFVVGWHILFRA